MKTTSLSRGMVRSTFFKLCSRAPRTIISSCVICLRPPHSCPATIPVRSWAHHGSVAVVRIFRKAPPMMVFLDSALENHYPASCPYRVYTNTRSRAPSGYRMGDECRRFRSERATPVRRVSLPIALFLVMRADRRRVRSVAGVRPRDARRSAPSGRRRQSRRRAPLSARRMMRFVSPERSSRPISPPGRMSSRPKRRALARRLPQLRPVAAGHGAERRLLACPAQCVHRRGNWHRAPARIRVAPPHALLHSRRRSDRGGRRNR